ncbi:MAG: AAA family ATPase [Synergistaceae bacterium]|nr:AAA family ATPase [Synergistaceae bacterium]
MAIDRVEIKDFFVFKGEFTANFCPGVNVLIGANATGKTTLLKVMYVICKYYPQLSLMNEREFGEGKAHSNFTRALNINNYFPDDKNYEFSNLTLEEDVNHACLKSYTQTNGIKSSVRLIYKGFDDRSLYIPEKDILEHAKGLLTFIEQKQTGFGQIYRNVLISAQDIPTQVQSETQRKVGKMIVDTIGGEARWDKGEGSFYTLRTDGVRIPFANEASGYKKLGFLGLLVTSGQLEKGSVLFWDEPENSLNPELLPVLVDILLELQRGGVQIFLATHSEILASYFSVNRQDGDSVMFYSLYKDGEQIKADKSERFDVLTPNTLTAEQTKLYEKELERTFGNG